MTWRHPRLQKPGPHGTLSGIRCHSDAGGLVPGRAATHMPDRWFTCAVRRWRVSALVSGRVPVLRVGKRRSVQ